MRCRRRKWLWAFVPPAESLSDRHASVSGERALRGLRLGRGGGALGCLACGSSLGHIREAREEVIPTFGVARDRFLRQAAVDETQARPRSHRLQVELYRARSGRDHLVTFPAPGEDDAPIAHDLDVLAGRDVLRTPELDAEPAVPARLELREAALPSDVLDGIGEQAEDGLRRRVDRDHALNDFRVEGHASWTSSAALRVPRRPSAYANSRTRRPRGTPRAGRWSPAAPGTGALSRRAARSPDRPLSEREGAARSPGGLRQSVARCRRR